MILLDITNSKRFAHRHNERLNQKNPSDDLISNLISNIKIQHRIDDKYIIVKSERTSLAIPGLYRRSQVERNYSIQNYDFQVIEISAMFVRYDIDQYTFREDNSNIDLRVKNNW